MVVRGDVLSVPSSLGCDSFLANPFAIPSAISVYTQKVCNIATSCDVLITTLMYIQTHSTYTYGSFSDD